MEGAWRFSTSLLFFGKSLREEIPGRVGPQGRDDAAELRFGDPFANPE
jgi:hypothetical protein